MPYRVFSTTKDILLIANTGCIWSTVLSKTCRYFAKGIGDLGSLQLMPPSQDPLTDSVNRQHLPEPFLWETFSHLAEAAVAMRDAPEEGLEIVHRDLKPGNSKTFHIEFFHRWDIYSTSTSIFRERERGERFLFLPSCQNR